MIRMTTSFRSNRFDRFIHVKSDDATAATAAVNHIISFTFSDRKDEMKRKNRITKRRKKPNRTENVVVKTENEE